MDSPTTNQSNGAPDLKPRVASLYAFMAKRLGIQQAPKVTLTRNPANAKKPFGLTAYYNQNEKSVRLYVTDRHPTDILRSFAHELIHHWQNEHGTLPQAKKGGHAHYAQNDPVLRKREMEAYLLGNILFRDWQDENRYGPINENLEITNSKVLKQSIHDMLVDLIKKRVIGSYHRAGTSGDMNPNDFIEDLSMKIELALEKLVDKTNDKGNWENQPNMIKELVSRRELKAFVKERIAMALEGEYRDPMFEPNEDDIEDWNEWHPNNPVKTVNDLLKAREKEKGRAAGTGNVSDWDTWGKDTKLKIDRSKTKGGKQHGTYSSWLKQFMKHSHSQNMKAQKYYEIGFDYDENHYCWYWNDGTKQVVAARGGSHNSNFGNDIPYKTFRGRYNPRTKELSLTIPEFGNLKVTGDIKKDVPPELIAQLKKVFHDPKIFYFPYMV